MEIDHCDVVVVNLMMVLEVEHWCLNVEVELRVVMRLEEDWDSYGIVVVVEESSIGNSFCEKKRKCT